MSVDRYICATSDYLHTLYIHELYHVHIILCIYVHVPNQVSKQTIYFLIVVAIAFNSLYTHFLHNIVFMGENSHVSLLNVDS